MLQERLLHLHHEGVRAPPSSEVLLGEKESPSTSRQTLNKHIQP